MNDKKLLNLDSITINRDPELDNEVVNKSYVDNEADNFLSYFNKHLDEASLLRLNDDSNDRYLQARVGKTACNLQIFYKNSNNRYNRNHISKYRP